MQAIDDLLVRVSRRDVGAGYAYSVELCMEGGRRIDAQEELQLDDYVEPQLSDAASLAAYGLDLFNRLFSGRLSVAFQQAWATAVSSDHLLRVRLALDPQAPDLHAVPWELLHFDDSGGMASARPLATDGRIVFSRYIESETIPESTQINHRPIRLLLVIADPIDLKERWGLVSVGRANEERDFHTRFNPMINAGQLRYDVLPLASSEDLHSAIAQGGITSEQPTSYDVLLFLGHAAYNQRYGTRLLLEDPTTRHVRLYPAENLVRLMQQLPERRRPRMVVLVACNTAVVTADRTMGSLATQLISIGGVAAVMAMQRMVEISLARRFTYQLSEHLLRDGLIDVAVNTARRRVYAANDIGWSTPTLYMRSADGRLFSPNAQLEYAAAILADPTYARWGGPEFIDTGVLVVAPGQSWSLLRERPEDAPASVSAIESLHRILEHGHPGAQRHRSKTPAGGYSNLTAIIGPPHSGQTTILQRLTYDLAQMVTNEPTSRLGMMISLTGYESQRGTGRLEHHIVEQASITSPALGSALAEILRPQSVIKVRHQRPRYVFLLDNFDSLPEKAQLDLAIDLADLTARMGDQYFVITASEENVPAPALRQAHVLMLQPLTEQQILRYIRQRESQGAYQIFSQIRDNRLLALASDPSMLSLIYTRIAGNPQARVTRTIWLRV
ncbi:MAG: CHAT domain-containing protein, partial [Oscillochloris sp.]|nr:CHAT domain-containing protein [Oscillochloris sp.]